MTIEVREPAPDSAFVVPADAARTQTPVDSSEPEISDEADPTDNSSEAAQDQDVDQQQSEDEIRAAKAAAKEAYRRRRAERESHASQERIRALEDQIRALSESRSTADRRAVADAPQRPDPKAYQLGRWDPQYEEDLTSWMDAREAHILDQAARRALETTSSITQEAAQIQERTKFINLADQVEQRGVDKYDDFLDIVQDALEAMPPHQEAVKRLVQLPNAEDVFYHLAQRPSELEMITGLDPMDQALEFGKISARLAAKSKAAASIPKAKPSPKAPRGDSGKFESESDARYAKMLKATRTW